VGADSCRIQLGYWIDRVRAGQEVVVTRLGKPVMRLTAVQPASVHEDAAAAQPLPLANPTVLPDRPRLPTANGAA
jgi:antitoxin (DNA-binding transcriptional repressor) of toxin-antitoxin stability system